MPLQCERAVTRSQSPWRGWLLHGYEESQWEWEGLLYSFPVGTLSLNICVVCAFQLSRSLPATLQLDDQLSSIFKGRWLWSDDSRTACWPCLSWDSDIRQSHSRAILHVDSIVRRLHEHTEEVHGSIFYHIFQLASGLKGNALDQKFSVLKLYASNPIASEHKALFLTG